MKITSDHVRYARNKQLSALTGITPEQFSRWTTNERFTMDVETAKSIGEKLGLSHLDVLIGFEARRNDYETQMQFQSQLDALVMTRATV